MNYIQEILKEKEQQDKRIQDTLATFGNLPDVEDPTKPVSFIKELIIKITYLHKVFFLSDLVELFRFSYSKQQLEKIVLELEETGYIKSQNDREYGKCFSLTKQSIYFIKYNSAYITVSLSDVSVNNDKIPSDLISYKCKSRITSSYIFNMQASELYQKFKNENGEYRKEYAKLQYIKHFLYKDFLQYPKSKKEEILKELDFEPSKIDKYSKSKIYSNSFADEFVNQYLIVKGTEDLEKTADYKNFRNAINTYCLKPKSRNNQCLFHFLYDFHTFTSLDKKEYLKATYELVLDMKNTYMRNANKRTVNYIDKHTDKDICKYQRELNGLLDKSLFLNAKRRNLINSHAHKDKKSISELQAVNHKIQELEHEISTYSNYKQFTQKQFQFLTYEKTRENGVIDFKEEEITINKLASKNIFITDIHSGGVFKDRIEFAVIQKNSDGFYSDSLFRKIELAYIYSYHVLKDYDWNFTIYTFGDIRKAEIEKALEQVKEKFQSIKEYRNLASTVINVVDCKNRNTERYQTYHFIKSEMERIS